MTFDPLNRATWPEVMTAAMVAAIYHRAVGGLKKSCQQRTFLPAPYRTKPWLWRKSDVLRDIDGPISIRRAG